MCHGKSLCISDCLLWSLPPHNSSHHQRFSEKQAISVHEWALCQLTVCYEIRVEVKEEKDTKVVPIKWYSQVKYQVKLLRSKM